MNTIALVLTHLVFFLARFVAQISTSFSVLVHACALFIIIFIVYFLVISRRISLVLFFRVALMKIIIKLTQFLNFLFKKKGVLKVKFILF
jgi:hypothetical protein